MEARAARAAPDGRGHQELVLGAILAQLLRLRVEGQQVGVQAAHPLPVRALVHQPPKAPEPAAPALVPVLLPPVPRIRVAAGGRVVVGLVRVPSVVGLASILSGRSGCIGGVLALLVGASCGLWHGPMGGGGSGEG